jgi:predicted LPLAT superfamily acyltransferase
MVALRRDFRRYEIFVEPLADVSNTDSGGPRGSIEELVDAFARRLEYYCTLAPYQWFNFYDFWTTAAGAPEPGRQPLVTAAAGDCEDTTHR